MKLPAKLAQWQQAGIIDSEIAARILAHEARAQAQAGGRPYLLYAVLGLGALSLCIGLISVVAANWDGIPAGAKLALDLLLLLGLAGGRPGRGCCRAWPGRARRAGRSLRCGRTWPKGGSRSASQSGPLPEDGRRSRAARASSSVGASVPVTWRLRRRRAPRRRISRVVRRGLGDLFGDQGPGSGLRGRQAGASNCSSRESAMQPRWTLAH